MAKPFLKWAGGKKWFVNRESARFPQTYNRYIEPFLGGGSVFFFLEPHDAILSDINQELIQTYISFKEEFPSVFEYLKNIIEMIVQIISIKLEKLKQEHRIQQLPE